jgi:site-specific recombinase XerD
VVLATGERTWTVLDGEHRLVEPAEQFLEYLRMLGRSPNTVKSYARALALWWQFLDAYELAWDAVTIEDLGRFLGWLRSGDEPELASIERRSARFCEGTVALRLQAVCSFYRYHHFNGVEAPRASMSACSPAGTPTSRCSSTSRAGEAMSVAL